MATYSKGFLTGSTSGRGIKVVATATSGTLIHTAVTGSLSKDEVYLYAYNSDTVDMELTIEFGGVTVPDDNIVVTIPYRSNAVLVIPGMVINNALVIRAFASSANKIVVFGFVNNIT